MRSVDAAAGAEMRRQLGIAPSATVIGYVGDIVERKGLVYLIRALSGILRAHPHVMLLAIGGAVEDGSYDRHVRREADRLGVAPRIVWAGARDDIPQLMQAIDIFALPSLQECMPLGILEAMAVGKPVIATSVGGISEAVIDGQTGLVVPPHSAEVLESALRRLVEQESLRFAMGHAGRRRIDAEFDPGKQTRKVLHVLENAASLRRRRRAS